MLSLGTLSFATPAALLALAVLPALWWLLRVIPPAPRRVWFPPIRLVAALAAAEQSVQRTPPWLLVLRLLLAAAVIFAAARPMLNAPPPLPGSGPIVVVLDDGWAAARDWAARQALLEELLVRAEREGRGVILESTAPTHEPEPLQIAAAETLRERVRALQPKPWGTDREAAIDRIRSAADPRNQPPGAVFWLADGQASGGDADLVHALQPFGRITVVAPDTSPVLLRPPAVEGHSLVLIAERTGDVEQTVWVRGLADDGIVLVRTGLTFGPGQRTATATVSPPSELAERLARFVLEGESTAGGVVLLDERWRRRPVGLVSEGGAGLPLLEEAFYVERAIEPYTEVRRGTIPDLLSRQLAVLVVADGSIPEGPLRDRVAEWVEGGGVLLRFAGPRLAANPETDDSLMPVPLRAGDRTLGGALAWREPARLDDFDAVGPFAGLAVPDDVEIRRQVLAEPAIDLETHTWARLDDGTPLVTAARSGRGWLILFHTTANAEWSNLALSGLFVEMLERIVQLSRGAVAEPGGPPLAPIETLDGFGRLSAPPPDARPLPNDAAKDAGVGPTRPPGFYGRGPYRRAVNLADSEEDVAPLGELPAAVEVRSYEASREVDLRAWLLTFAMVLALTDLFVSLAMRGLLRPLPGRRRAASAGAASLVAGVLTLTPLPLAAEEIVADGTAPPATTTTRLAFVVTGDPETDAVSRDGLTGLSAVVNRRTAAELGPPDGVDPARDELAFYPLLYWPIPTDGSTPSPEAVANVRRFMSNGGTVLFDTRDQGGGRRVAAVRAFARALEIPPLVPVPKTHVLGRAYYLLESFPGRWSGGEVWVERSADRFHDGVTAVVAGSHDWAAAWAVNDRLRPIYPVVPGGERQREIAYRFGINLVMHVLTGNYKADQVHLPAILERLGR